MDKKDNIIDKSFKFAIKVHRDCNHFYNDKPYEYHLEKVYIKAFEFIELIPEKDQAEVLAGCWVHDIIEDARKLYTDVKKETNETVTEYAYALTNEKGRNRKERANKKYYDELKEYKHASFIKLCDRIANVEYSKSLNSNMFDMYKKEQKYFKETLYDGRWDSLWNYLENLFN